MIARKSVLIFVANLFASVLAYVGILVIARLTPNADELLGFIGVGMGVVGSAFILTGLGVPAAHTKRVSQGEPLGECMGAFVLLRVAQIALAVAVTLTAIFVWTSVLGRGFQTPLHLRILYIMLVYYVATSAAQVGLATFNARMEAAKGQASNLVSTVVRVAGMILVALFGLGAIALAWTYVAGALAMAAVALLLMRIYPLRRPSASLVRSYLRFAFPLALPAALAGLSTNIDKALIQLFWGVSEVGYYFTVQRIIMLLTLLTSAVSLLLFPTVSRHHARNEMNLLRVKTQQSERYLSMILAPVAAFLFVYPEGVIHVLLADDFLPAVDILRVFGIATFVLALTVPRSAILTGMDRADLAGTVALGGALLTLILYPLLIPTSIFDVPLAGLGPEGAAVGVLAGNVLQLGIALLLSYRLVGDRLSPRLALHVLAAVAVGVLFFWLSPAQGGVMWRWFHLVGVSALFLGAYLLVLVALREFRRDDLRLFLDLLNPWKMARYVYGELRENELR